MASIGIGLGLRAAGPAEGGGIERTANHVFLLAGEGDMVGQAPDDGGPGYPADILQYDRFGALVAAEGALDHVTAAAGLPAIALGFALRYRSDHPHARITFIPAAATGSGFSDARWTPGGDLFADAVARTNALLSENPDFAFKGILWHQGASDAVAGAAGAYADQLDEMIDGLRTNILRADAETPVVCGGLLPERVGLSQGMAAVDAALAGAPDRRDHVACAAATGLTAQDGVHFDAASLRLFGTRYRDAYVTALVSPDKSTGWSLQGSLVAMAPAAPEVPVISGTFVGLAAVT